MNLMMRWMCVLCLAAVASGAVSENVYKGELLNYPGAWGFQIGRSAIILVRDDELEALASNPDLELNLSLGRTPEKKSLRQICERAREAGERTLVIAFDQFFKQYRAGQDTPRRLMPDMDEYIRKIATVGKFAAGYGLGLELSLLSPLEIGKAYAASAGESGVWMHYREGLRDPRTGAFSVELWRNLRWVNNKGPIDIVDAGVRVFAFREKPLRGTPYMAVDPAGIVEIKSGIEVERFDNLLAQKGDFRAVRVRVHGRGAVAEPGLDHVVVVQMYRTPEMDYFSPKALPFLTGLIDRYTAAGIKLNALYADEMHIQQDWNYFDHHDHGEFAMRYVSPGLQREYAARYGAEYADFAKYLIYFVHGQEDFTTNLSAKQGVMHTLGASPEQIQQTALLRARYYRLLQDGVVDLFVKAKRYTEEKMGHKLESRAHATWAESPTIDYWSSGRPKYEYTPDFVWSNTVQQAAAACDDYFKWGDFLTGNGNDHAEGGWIDRDYFALALAASTGILNEIPYSYAAHWGHPEPIMTRRSALVSASGAVAEPGYALVEESQHRDAEVLMLYPLDLAAVEERFGSWMAQYGYTNYVTAAKLVERGRVRGKSIEMAGRRFTTLVALFEPFPKTRLLEMMREFAANGGRVVWSGPPPMLTFEGTPSREIWQEIFGVDIEPAGMRGLAVPDQMVRFEGPLREVQPQLIPSDLLVDRVYPVTPRAGTVVTARTKSSILGTRRGSAWYLGYRPRDDQSKSLGYDVRNWFEVLDAVGAYPGADNPERLSRTGDYLACRFPNGTVALAPHLREIEETWPGGFARDEAADAKYLAANPPPSNALRLRELRVNGQVVGFEGEHAVAFRLDAAGELLAFAGRKCHEITVNGRRSVFAERDLDEIAWAPVAAERRVEGGAVLQILVRGTGTVRIPRVSGLKLFAEGARPGSRGRAVACRYENGTLVFEATPELSGRWIYGLR